MENGLDWAETLGNMYDFVENEKSNEVFYFDEIRDKIVVCINMSAFETITKKAVILNFSNLIKHFLIFLQIILSV